MSPTSIAACAGCWPVDSRGTPHPLLTVEIELDIEVREFFADRTQVIVCAWHC